ncbi:MAG TPA: hypothetical protein VF698_04595 [Thermoanaerobaculia bacterium]|jgi:hypothetical protein
MAGNPREHVKDKGFWDGGDAARGTNKESGGRPSGLPGMRQPKRVGIRTDMDFPESMSDERPKS